MKKLKVTKVIDQYGWSYDFIGREQKRYSTHDLTVSKFDEIDFNNADVLYLHSPNIEPYLSNEVPLRAKEKGIKVIGGYGGDPKFWHHSTDIKYSYADLLVTISPETYHFAKRTCPGYPVIFLPESIDTNFFKQIVLNNDSFNVGWAGSNFTIKRTDILDRLKYSVIRQSQWGFEHFKKDRPIDYMIDFYHSLNVFVLTSVTECMPRVILEAMSCGLPVVATGVGCIPFLLEEDWIVPVNPEETVISEINNRLDLLKNDFELQKKVGERNRKYVENNFSWKKNQKIWDKVFSDLVENNLPGILQDNNNYLKKYKKYFISNIDIDENKPKIAYLLPGTGISGGIAVILQHANRLLEKGYDVFLISQNLEEEIDWFPNRVPIYSLKTRRTYLFNNIDILIATSWDTVVNITMKNLIDTNRIIYFVQSDERRFFEEEDMKKLVHQTYEMKYEYMTEARWIQKWLKSEFGHEAHYVPNGLDDEIFYNTDQIVKKEKVRVLLEGPIVISFKGVEDAYEAVKDLDCEIWIISSAGSPKSDWRYDKFFERVPINQMREIYSSCDILLKMSRVEGFFGPPMEAMACGCSVVTGKCTGYDEYIYNEQNALVVNMGDVKGAKQAVARLINDKKLREKLIQNGYQTIKNWKWSRSIRFLEDIINKRRIKKGNKCDIIIVSYNAAEYLKRCIESIEKYTTFPYQIIIVDNNSNYQTKIFLTKLQTEKKAKVIFNDRNFGFGYANNQGLYLSKSDYICFINPDTIVTKGWLTNLIDVFENERAGMVGPVTNFVASSCQKVDLDFIQNVANNDDFKIQKFSNERFIQYYLEVIETNRLVGFCMLTKKDIINNVGNFDERFKIGMFEDDDFCNRIIERGFRLFCANGVFIYHFGGESFFDSYKVKTHQKILETNQKIYTKKWFDSNRISEIHLKKKPLKISYLLASDCATGGVKIVFEHANRLKARGHDVTIYSVMNENQNWFKVNVPIIYTTLENIPDCDIVVGTYFSTLKFLRKVKASVKIHLCQGYEGLLHSDNALVKTIKESYEVTKIKITVSEWLKNIVDKEFGIDSHFISNGIDQYVFSFKKHKRNNIPKILVVGTDFLQIKGTDNAIEAVKKLLLERKVELVRLSTSEQLNKNVNCKYYDMTKMTQREIAEVYESCDVTICASEKVEGFSLPPLESMASGTPVITTDSGGVTTYAENNENSVIIPSNSPTIIFHHLKLLLDNNSLYEKLIENGIKTAEKYYWYKQIDKLESLYYSLYENSLKLQREQLSVCLIVKDEEENLERCLESIKDIASEIIMIDTGSTDNTIQIAKRFGADIYHFKWCDDFSAARNFSLEKAKQHWTLILDADESISLKDISKLKKLLRKKENVAYNFITRNYVDSYDIQGIIVDNSYDEGKDYCGWCRSSKVRLFPTNNNIRFEGKVHELVEKSLKNSGIKITESEIPIHHYGYLEQKYKKKSEKYLDLNIEKVKSNINDLKSIVELADQYMALNNYDEALVLWRRALTIMPNDSYFLAKTGTTFNLLGDYRRAEEYFQKSINIEETEYAFQHLGICYAKQENYQEAYKVFKKIVFQTSDIRTKANFAFCCNFLEKYDESIIILEKCLKIDRKQTISWGLLEIAYNEKGIELAKKEKFALAINMFRSALKINPKFKNARLNVDELNRIIIYNKQKVI